ncbi:hypothetical protein CQW23_21223 [Capsicum baccatum]|uniref:Uncharacterized protein n=1 Tax=Capsicum baccatum TaxID=33114 RepID=A0A2G2VXE2_CAPBA|nr:hypothetical protein CQW23_21223 [Capsicum baccatum]
MSDTPSLVAGSPDTPSSIDILIGSSSSSSTTRRLVISIFREKFVPNGHSISKTITENFKERQDATGYTWKVVTESTRKFYGHEFMDKMEVVIATALLGSSDDSSEDQKLDINSMYFDVEGGSKRRCVYGLGSEASTLYKDQNSVKSANLVSDHVAEECAQCGFDIHIDYVPIRCDKKTTTDQGIPTYVPPSLLFPAQSYLGGYDYGIPHSHPLNMNHNYMPLAQSQLQPRPQPHQQHQIHEIPHWHPSTSPYFPSPLNMPQPKPQLQHQNYGNPWHPSTSSPCFPSQLNMNHNNISQPKPQLQHQNNGILYRYPNPNPFPNPSNMHHYNHKIHNYSNNNIKVTGKLKLIMVEVVDELDE